MSPEDTLRQQLMVLLRGRIDRIRDTIKAYDAGSMGESKALSVIEEIASGEADRIVTIGNKHLPEVQT